MGFRCWCEWEQGQEAMTGHQEEKEVNYCGGSVSLESCDCEPFRAERPNCNRKPTYLP